MELDARYGVLEAERSRVRPLGDLERPRDRGSGGWRDAIGMVEKEGLEKTKEWHEKESQKRRNEMRHERGDGRKKGFTA